VLTLVINDNCFYILSLTLLSLLLVKRRFIYGWRFFQGMKIFVASPNANLLLTKDLRALLEKTGEVKYLTKITPFDKIKELSEPGDKILALDPDFSDWKVPNSLLDIPDLKAVCLQTTSFSWIDVDHAKEKGVPVMNIRNWSTYSVAEWIVMVAINLSRKIPLLLRNKWQEDYSKQEGIELRGKTAGIIGLGNIGTRIAELCKGLGMNIIYWSKNSRDDRFKYKELKEVMASADFIFPAFAHTPETEKLLTDDLLKSMKSSAIFATITHLIYNHKLLLEMVKEGRLFGYGFEEMKKELRGTHEGNVWGGPGLGWCTTEALRRNAEQWVESVVKATSGEYTTKVN